MTSVYFVLAAWLILPSLFFARIYYVRTHRAIAVPMVPMPSGSMTEETRS